MRMRSALLSCRLSRSANSWGLIASVAMGLRFLGADGAALAAEVSDDRPEKSYEFILEIAPKEGPAQRFLFVGARGKLEVSFVSGQADLEATSIPTTASFTAEVEPLPDARVWLGQLSFRYTVPYVTGFTEYGSASVAPDGSRGRAVPSRAARSVDDGGPSVDAAKPEEPASRPSPPRPMSRSVVQQMNVGITTSLALKVGKKVNLFEDSRGQVRLTVKEMPE